MPAAIAPRNRQTVGSPPPFRVPVDISVQLQRSESAARTEMQQWLSEHPKAQRTEISRFIASTVTEPPTAEDRAPELERLARIHATATPTRDRISQWYAGVGYPKLDGTRPSWWPGEISTLDDPKHGAQMVQSALDIADSVWRTSQNATREPRPFVLNQPAPPGGWDERAYTSHPSGHASATYAAAHVMGALNPERAHDYENVARRVAFSRLYDNMHYPHDVILGARVGAMSGVAALALDARRTSPPHA